LQTPTEKAKAVGYTKEELLQKGILELIGPVEGGKGSAYFDEALNKGEARTDSFFLRKKDATPLEVDLSTKRVDLEDESFYQMIFRDLTEQRNSKRRSGSKETSKRFSTALQISFPSRPLTLRSSG
jgi:PAS domain S-box-containing protein